MFNSGNNKTPVRIDAGKSIDNVSSEVVAFLTSAGAVDAGEGAGTIVYGQLAKSPVLNKIGDREGEYTGNALSTSISFTTGVMDSTKEVGFVYDARANDRLTRTAEKLTVNGQWACDYFTGLLVICKASAGTSQAITSYKARAGTSSGVGASASQVQGTAASGATDVGNPVKVGGIYNTSLPTLTNGQRGDLQMDASGRTLVVATGNVASSATDSGNPVKVGGVYNTSPTALTNGQRGTVQLDTAQNVQVNNNTLISGEFQGATQALSRLMVSMPGTSTRITTATTTLCLTGAGIIKRILIKAVLAGTVTIYDEVTATGTVIDVLPIGLAANSYELNYKFSIGCTVVTSAGDNITVVTEPN